MPMRSLQRKWRVGGGESDSDDDGCMISVHQQSTGIENKLQLEPNLAQSYCSKHIFQEQALNCGVFSLELSFLPIILNC